MLHVTLIYAGLLGLLFLGLSAWVIRCRFRYRVSLGDGNEPVLRAAMRAHGNFAEYVPLVLLLMGGGELTGAAMPMLHGIGLLLLGGRLLHAVGVQQKRAPNPARQVGMVATFTALLLASGQALYLGF
ncbi:hypothetical protein G114_12283 [Aeromonas diversa CDC 2478-85]|uniref:Glutathione S-transferase n=1 Tax=Aeromonas diversa CDC 2478-85 TaxID=1268237 RepID=N9TZP4_9GAMM|nr:MAPEG family protein [Aeromonas diversa]ENY71594.1 hypothetical protein G114_12283 [Aeromonas diversa CDC 2478-85]